MLNINSPDIYSAKGITERMREALLDASISHTVSLCSVGYAPAQTLKAMDRRCFTTEGYYLTRRGASVACRVLWDAGREDDAWELYHMLNDGRA